MAFIEWKSELSVGVAEFDEQHRQLVALINKLHDAMAKGTGREVLGTVFGEILSYTDSHFAAEERLMQQHGYPLVTSHALQHRNLVKQAKELQETFMQGTATVSIDTLKFLKEWLAHHIMETDKKYGPFFNGKGVR